MADFNCRVSGLLINNNKEILLIHRNIDYVTDNKAKDEFIGWEFCGGGIEHNENPEQAIVREYKEETGIDIIVTEIFSARTSKRDSKDLLNITYLCEYKSGDVILTEEHKSHKWLPITELGNYDFGIYSNTDRDKLIKTS